MPNLNAMLGALGLDPDKIMKDFENLTQFVEQMKNRLTAIEENQARIIALLEGLKKDATS